MKFRQPAQPKTQEIVSRPTLSVVAPFMQKAEARPEGLETLNAKQYGQYVAQAATLSANLQAAANDQSLLRTATPDCIKNALPSFDVK